MSNQNADHYFLKGGGEMGELIRAKDWSKTSLGDPAEWPQSLRTMVAVMLDNPFGMYIAWGNEYIQLYNDGYRPILGASKHPQALGISTRETFSEIWDNIIGSMFDDVMEGKAVGFSDLMLPLNRNGFVEECYFDFAYSPIRKNDGEVGGVLVTVIETTDKKKAQVALLENSTQLKFAMDAAELGAWDYNPATNKFTANNRLKTWFGLSGSEEIELHHATDAIAEKDRDRIIMAIKKVLDYSSGGIYEEEYSIINPLTNKEIVVQGKGRVWFNDERIAYRFNGVLQEVTENVLARKKIEDSEKQKEFLLKLSDTLRQQSNPNGIEEAVTKIAMDFLEVDWCHFCIIEGDNIIIHRDAVRGTLPSVVGLYPISSYPLFKAILDNGHPFVVDNVQTTLILDAELKQLCMHSQNIAFINVPVIKNGKAVAMLSLVQSEARNWTDAEVQLTIAIAERTWAAIERTKAEKTLIKSEEKYRTLFNSIDQGFLLGELIRNNEGKGIDYYVHEVNSTYEKQTGINIELVLGKTVLQAFPTIDKWWIETYASVVDNQYPVRFEKFFEFTNRWFDIKASPAGKEMFTILFTDITESRLAVEKIKESEEQFSTLADNMENLAWMADGNGKRYWYNKRWLEYTGLTMEESQGWGWQKVHHPDHVERLAGNKKIWHTNETFELTLPLRRHDGEYRWFLTRGFPLVNEEGKIIRWIGTNTDIDEQKKEEDQFRVLADQAPMWVWQTDKEINVLYANPEVLRFIGIAHYTEFIGRMWEQKVHPEDIALVYKSFGQAVSGQQTFSLEFRVQNAMTQQYEWFYIKGVPRMEAGEFTGFIGTGVNIHEQKIILSQLEYRKALLEAHNEASIDGILIVDAKGKILTYNHRFVEIWNMPQQIVDDKDDEAALTFALTQMVHPEQFIEKVKWLYEHPDEISIDELEFKDGKIIERHGYPVTAQDGSYYAWSWRFRDITEQRKSERVIKESEERFRSLAQTLPQLVWMTDAQGNQEFASSRWKEYTGIDTGGEKEWREMVHPDDYDGITAAWIHSLSTQTVYKADVRLKNKAGEYRWHTVIGEPVLDNENKIVKWVGAFTDIQEQKIKEEKKDEFISIASHEMKTPLTTAKAYLQMLELLLDEKNEDAKLYAKKASQSANRLNELISELLDVSKIRLGKLNYTFTSFNFDEMIESTVENMQLTSQTHTIIKTGKVCDEVTGDKERLQQVVINLLTNAIKYSPGSEKVFINLTLEKDKITLSVKDAGIGIAQQSLDKIFEKYHRVEEHAVHFQGLGIGLFISYEIIQRHHGKLWAESEPGKGSTFYFTIPVNSNLKQ